MAYFIKRGAKWSFVIDTPIASGKRKQVRRSGFSTKKEAQEAAITLQKEINDGIYITPTNIPFKCFSEDYWLPIYSKSVKAGSVRVRKHELSLLLSQFGDCMRLKDISSVVYERAMLEIFDKYAHNTACGVHGTARMIFKKAKKDELIIKDPTEFFRAPRKIITLEQAAQGEVPRYLEKEQLVLFLKLAQEVGMDEDYIIFKLLSYTGMRIGELCALKWSDIDFKSGTLQVNKTYYNEANTPTLYELTTPKTKASIREIELDPRLLSELSEHKIQQHFIKGKCPTWLKEDFVFTHIDYPGYPKYPKMLGYRMKRVLLAAGLASNLSPHSLRHTHCSLMAEAGASLEEIQTRLGQVDDDTTKNVYLHITKALKKQTSQKFSKLMQGLL